MPSIANAPGTVVDAAGTGTITPANTTVKAGGANVLTIGDVVSAHSSGSNTHSATTVSTGSGTVKIGGKGVAYSGSTAGCGGSVTTTFTASVQVGG